MNSIQLKRSNTAGSKPVALASGEPAVNLADHRLFLGGAAADGYPLGCQSRPSPRLSGKPKVAGAGGGTKLASATVTAQQQYFVPFVVPRPMILSQLGAYVAVNQFSTVLHVGIYGNLFYSGEDHPGPIIAAVTNLSSATTGLKSGSVSATLEPGRLYWASVLSSGSPGLIGIVTAAANGDYAISDSDYMTAITHQYLSGVSSMADYASGALGAVVSGTGTAPAVYLYE
ncbi:MULTISPECIES: hypothetical protein [unclassified Methylococcus]|uniref:hypothetical protein n=1 Tax=unclassified Methylococcus TaxID=2618889 RepID=UPI003D7CEDA0